MIVNVALAACVAIIFYLISINVKKIKTLEQRYSDNIALTTSKLNDLNSKISTVVTKNNEINITNIQTLLKKIEAIEDVSTKSDDRMKVELENLKRKLIFLLENNDVYGMMMKNYSEKSTEKKKEKK
tara:strand:+ start:367 stop:747 length:381 start_codon:yes stop_codon:yes gene_type:complete